MTTDLQKLKSREELIRLAEKELGHKFNNLNAKQQSIRQLSFMYGKFTTLCAFKSRTMILRRDLSTGKMTWASTS